MNTNKMFQLDWEWWNTDKITDEYYTRALDKDSVGWIVREYALHPYLFRYIGNVKGLKALDNGCANGWLTNKLAKMNASAYGCDISENYIKKAIEDAQKMGLEIDYKVIESIELPYSDKEFNILISNLVLDCIRPYREAIGQMHRVLVDDGRAIVSITHPNYFKQELVDFSLSEQTIPVSLTNVGSSYALNYCRRETNTYEKNFRRTGFKINRKRLCFAPDDLIINHPELLKEAPKLMKYCLLPYFLVYELFKKNTRHAGSLAVFNDKGEVMLGERGPEKYPYSGKLSLLSLYFRDSENNYVSSPLSENEMKKQLIEKVKQNLNIEIELMDIIGQMKGRQENYDLTMTTFIGGIIKGEPKPDGKYYSDVSFFDPEIVSKIKPKGFCTRILKNKLKENPDFWKKYF